MLGIGKKVNLNVPYFESNYACLLMYFLLLNIQIIFTLNIRRHNPFVSNVVLRKGQKIQL
jgi:hypothetical protein